MLRNLPLAVLGLAAIASLVRALAPGVRALPPASATHADAALQASLVCFVVLFVLLWCVFLFVPEPPADSFAVVRRLSLSLMGTVPSLEELRALVELPDDQCVAAYLDMVLANRRSAACLAARFTRAFVGVKEGVFIVYRRGRFASWLAEQLHANRPYDETVREMLTADGMGTDRPAVNFILASMTPGTNDPEPNPIDLASRVARVMLGVRLDCAECHDHPFEQWTQKDFHGLAAFFDGTSHSFAGIHDDEPEYEYEDHAAGAKKKMEPRVPFAAKSLPASGPARERIARWVTDDANVRFSQATVNRIWALMFGRGLVEPIDDIRSGTTVPAQRELLARDFREYGYDLHRLIRVIAGSRAFQLDSRMIAADETVSPDEHEQLWAIFPLTRLRPEQVVGSLEQSSSLTTRDRQSNLVMRVAKTIETDDFLKRYGDVGEDEMNEHGGTIPQCLLMMNGKLVKEKTKNSPLFIAASQIALFASTAERAVDLAYMTVLTRLPTSAEREHFVGRLREVPRKQAMEDICWTLINSTEFACNH